MKLKVKHFDEKVFQDKLNHLSHIDFTLFVDNIPESQDDLSSINIISFQEPNEYFGIHDWVINNKDLFQAILTWSDKVLNNCENAIFLPFGSTWLKPEQYKKNYEKNFQVSHVRGNLFKTYGHSIRFEYHDRSHKELKIPFKSWEVAGIREKIETCANAKCDLFGDSQFGVAIENTSHRGYFTEKIMELFLFKTIPLYWGCSNIGDFFNPEGIITFNNVDDAIYTLNNLDENYYNDRIKVIEENYYKALKYIDYEQNIVDKITEIFKHNNLI
jgi:hypothetical protein